VGTANFVDPNAMIEITDGIRDFLIRMGLQRPLDLTGRVRAADRVPEPAHRRG
jgi:hypothetical protein